MVKYASKPRLDAYIKSNGTKLPSNWALYARPGKHAIQCLFCPNDHEYAEVFVYPAGITTRGAVTTGTFMCESCFQHVKIMEAARTVDRSGLFPKKESEWKMELFLEHAMFVPSVHLHYMHLERLVNHSTSPIPPSMWHRCYFCNSLWDEHAHSIKVPVGADDVISGGNIKVCNACWDKIRLEMPATSIEEHFGKHSILEFECPTCGEPTPCTSAEMDDQSVSQSIGYHQCSRCSIEAIIDTNSVLFEKYSETYSETGLPNRFIYATCEYCQNDVDVDLTLLPNHIETSYISFNDLIMCPDCAQGTAGPLGILRLSPHVWGIYPTGVSGVFRVIVRHSSGRVLFTKIVREPAANIIVNYKDYIDLVPNKQLTVF